MHKLAPLVVVLSCLVSSIAEAQPKEKKFKPIEIKKVRVGFHTVQDKDHSTYKVGQWTPIHVEIFGGTDGISKRPDETDEDKHPQLIFETSDSEDVPTQIRMSVDVEKEKTRTFTGYVKTGHMGRNLSEVNIVLKVHGRKYEPKERELSNTIQGDQHLYLTLGAKMPDLSTAARRMQGNFNEDKDFIGRADNNVRLVVFELNPERLPERWFGYNSVDLMVLTTENRRFLQALNENQEQVRAISQWVRRGGRLIVPIAWEQQDMVHTLLDNPAWEPRIPVKPPAVSEKLSVNRLTGLENWARLQAAGFFPREGKGETGQIPIATLDPGQVPPGDWEVLAPPPGEEPGAKPLITRMRYGLGQIVYVAISLEDRHFNAWVNGKDKFLQFMIEKFAPKAPAMIQDRQFGMGRDMVPNDVTTTLLGQLDNFDVTVIPFGYVALFIVLYILVVGPIDFLLLKYVFKRLEWTWITFPTVVLAVSVAAYFAAFWLKGDDLKINKVDIVDFDLRTNLDKKTRQPVKMYAYGQSFFTILSPHIQNYTIGLEPNQQFWGDPAPAKPNSVDLMSWMGRPSGGMHDMGRGGSGLFHRNPYVFRDDASAIYSVPIPVWTTKAFAASWEQKLQSLPFVTDLKYHQREVGGKELKITGKLENHLNVDLVDVWICYDNNFYPIESGLKSVRKGAPAPPISIADKTSRDVKDWVHTRAGAPDDKPRAWTQDPTSLIKQIMFSEAHDVQGVTRNHLLRPLDLSWRVHKETLDKERRTREAILFARVDYRHGRADSLMRDENAPMPTKLWLQSTPHDGRQMPTIPGQLNQDTYIRVLLPLHYGDD